MDGLDDEGIIKGIHLMVTNPAAKLRVSSQSARVFSSEE
jgi:hypothetical protein